MSFMKEPPTRRWPDSSRLWKFLKDEFSFRRFRSLRAAISNFRTRTSMEKSILPAWTREFIRGESRDVFAPFSTVEAIDSDFAGDDAGIRRHRRVGAAERSKHHLCQRRTGSQSEFPGL